jgi:hypothetical protein
MTSLKIILLGVVMLVALVGLASQTPEWQWAVRAGGTDDDYCYDIAIDSQGNQYVTGDFNENAAFGTHNLPSFGSYDIFVAKLDPAGNFLWSVNAGGTTNDQARSIAVDGAGNVWLTGLFQRTATFGNYTLTSSGSHDIFAAKLDSAGNFLWAVRAGGTNSDIGNDIAVDGSGNAWLTGQIHGTADFGPYTLNSFGDYDIFAAKLDPDGNFIWAVNAGGTSYDYGYAIAVDSVGNACLTGHFYGTASFGSYSFTSSGHDDIFAAKLDSAGNWLWAARAGGTSLDEGQDIAVDSAGNAWLTGDIGGATTSFGDISLTSNGSLDIFICKIDPTGNFLWAINAGGTSADYGYGIAIDSAGNGWLTGLFRETAAFGTYSLTSSGDFDIFAAKIDPAGNFIWAVRAGGDYNDLGYSIATDGAGNAWLTGDFEATASFGPYALTSTGYEDIFVAKLGSGTPVDDELNPPAVFPMLSASPNPFAASTVIKVGGGKPEGWSGNASLVIHNLKGQKVRSLPLATVSTNGFELNWDGRDELGAACPNGIYLALLDLDGRRATLRLSLVK